MHSDEFERFKRDINLVEYAGDRYGYQHVRRESSRASASLRHPGNDDKIIVSKASGGHWVYFSVRDDRDNGTIVDFVLRRENKSLGEVRDDLRQWLGLPRPERSLAERAPDLQPVERSRHAVVKAVAAAMEAENSRYLNTRGLRPETLTDPRFMGTWKQDAKGNALFLHRDDQGLSGFEIKNDAFTGFATGGTKALWQSRAAQGDNCLVVAESAIDALSYHQLRRAPAETTRYASLGGSPSPSQLALVHKALASLPRGATLVAAVDSDSGGVHIAKQLEAVVSQQPGYAFRLDTPDKCLGKDWNDVLQRVERDFIRTAAPPLTRRSLDPQRSR
jgi:hypothetical protein